jgi:pimeloyl-ACP methyl ester carboxylesterase
MANVVKKHSISYELAQKMVDEAVAKARKIGVTENVAILDDRGNLRAFGRMDGAEVNEKVAPAQIEAIGKWGAPREKPYDYLKSITQPTLVVNGSNDVIIYTVNSFILQQHLPNAQLILYPDSAHGSQYQYPELFVRHVSMFLSDEA